jgi:hypothetical protein
MGDADTAAAGGTVATVPVVTAAGQQAELACLGSGISSELQYIKDGITNSLGITAGINDAKQSLTSTVLIVAVVAVLLVVVIVSD